jgi:hypothetical protein
MARNWRGLCPAVDCSGLMMMMMKSVSLEHYDIFQCFDYVKGGIV